MSISATILVIVIAFHVIAFVLAIGAESRRNVGKVIPDEYDETTYCSYGSDASTLYGVTALLLLLLAQILMTALTRCLCFGKGLMSGCYKTFSIFFFVLSWLSFLGAAACLLAGSARNAYHTKYRGTFGVRDLSCASLRKGVFGAAAALCILSLMASVLYYFFHRKADTGGWQKQRNGDMGMSTFEQKDETMSQKP